MKIDDRKDVLLKIFLLSRFIGRASKKFNNEKTIRFSIMFLLAKKPMTISELADLFTVNHSFMSATLTKMEEEDLVYKKGAEDQRCRLICLSAKGKKIREAVQGEGHKISDILFKNVKNDEVKQLGKLISKLNLDYKSLIADKDFDFKSLK